MALAVNHKTNDEQELKMDGNRIAAFARLGMSNTPVRVDETLDIRKPAWFLALIPWTVAKFWLENYNTRNRTMSPKHVSYLAKILDNHEWRADLDDPIVFDWEGNLQNGQHRLEASVKTKRDIIVPLRTGADPALYKYRDSGKPRTYVDRSNYSDHNWQNQVINKVITAWIKEITGDTARLSQDARDKFFEDHKEELTWIAEANASNSASNVGVNRAAICVALCQFYRLNPTKAMQFQETLYAPTGPIQQATVLRDFIIRNHVSKGPASNARNSEIIRYCYCAMNAFLDNRPLGHLRQAQALKGYKE